MASLKSLKVKIHSYKKTGTVTHAMEAVSAVKMRKSQERALSGRSYAAAALSVLERLAGASDDTRHPLMRSAAGKTCFILITSDKGLAGALNSAVIRAAEIELGGESGIRKDDVIMIALGRRGGDHFGSRGWDVRVKRENVSDQISEEEVRRVTDQVLDWRKKGEIATCHIIYQNFISTFEQQPVVRQIIPITPENMREIVKGIRPARGRYAPSLSDAPDNGPSAYTIEPDPDSVLAILLPKLLNIAIFHGLLEAKASEHSARMVAMKSATDKAKDMAHDLTRTFNKARQATITREVSEITSGIEAMK